MKLNCKPGQLAIKIKSLPGHQIPVGAIVRVLSFVENQDGFNIYGQFITGWRWDVEYQGSATDPLDGLQWMVEDRFLQPLPELGDDEEDLYMVEKPIEEEA